MTDLDPWLSERLAASSLFVDAEQRVEAATRAMIERWLAAVRRLVLGAESVTAAGPPDLGGFAASEPEWAEAFNQIARPVLEDLFSERFLVTARVATISAQPYRQAYIEEVFSRLVLFPAEQFEQIRPELEEAISEGETIEGVRSRIEAILDFDTAADAAGDDSHAESRRIQARINQVERRLEQPGVTQDEAAELRAERRRLYPELYASRRRWQWKAQRIARTETSGALNGGAYWGAVANAQIFGEVLYKQWLSTDDERTRPTHVAADGQVRRLAVPFIVGAAPLRHPSDPLGPPHETIQCRCTALFLDADELTEEQREAADADPTAEGEGEGESTLEPLDDVPGAVDALTTTPAEADAEEESEAGELIEVDGESVFVPAALLGDDLPADLEPYEFAVLLAVYPRYAGLEPVESLRILERLDELETLANAAASAAGDAAVEAMVEAGDAAGAVEATTDAWGLARDAWAGDDDGDGEGLAAPWSLGDPVPEPRGEGPGYRYDPDVDNTVVDVDVPAGWVLYEDPETGARSYYEAAGMPKGLSRAARLAAAKAAYGDWVHQQFLDAEAATRGNLFSKAGLKAGVPERSLWSSNATSARAWASEELLRYWQMHPRLTQVEWLYAETRDERYRAQAQRAAENNAKILGAFSLVTESTVLATKAERRASAALTAAAGRTGYSRAQLAGAWVAGARAGEAGLEVTACPYRPRVEGLLALLWVRAWRTQGPQTIIASGDETIMADLPNGWRGVIAALNVPTGDNRVLAVPEGGVRLRTPPLSLLWQRNLAAGHDGAAVVGRIDRAWLDTVDGVDVIAGEGPLDLGGEDGAEAARLLAEGMFNGVSLDPDEVTFAEEFRDRDGNVVDPESMDIDDFYDAWDAGDITAYMIMSDWRMMGATLTPQPAFNQARVEAVFDYQPAGAQTGDLEAVTAAAGEQYEPLAGPLLGKVVQPVPAEHYDNPDLGKLTPLTVADDGRVFGHIAAWDSCHIGFGDTCVAAPHSLTAYAHFHLGEIITDRGRIAAGKLTHGGGHADPKLGFRAAIEHYDNVASAVAGVRAGEDEFGIWVAGRVLSGVPAATIERFLLCPPSGDWRRISGNLELVAACSVTVPGFPVPRTLAASAGGIQNSLIAAGAAPLRRARRRLDRARGPVDLDRLATRIAKQVRAYDVRGARAEQLARRIGRDTGSRAARAMARIDDNRGA